MNIRQHCTILLLSCLFMFTTARAQRGDKRLILRSDFPAKTVTISNTNQEIGKRTPFLVAATLKDETPKEVRSLLQFNYNYLPDMIMKDPTRIVSAELILYPANAGILSNDQSKPGQLMVKRILENWSDSNTAWDNQPKADSVSAAKLQVKIKKKTPEIRINVTLLVMDMILHGNNGFMISRYRTPLTYSIAGLSFASSLNEDKLLRPLLEITYYDAGYSVPDGVQPRRPVSAPVYLPVPRNGGNTSGSNRSER